MSTADFRCGWPWRVEARVVLGLLSLSGFAANLMARTSLEVVVDAIGNRTTLATPLAAPECKINATVATSTTQHDFSAAFEWGEGQQGMISAAFFWGHLLSGVGAGVVAERGCGAKLLLCGANLVTGLVGLLLPLAARASLDTLLAARFLQGLASGIMWPAMNAMAARWIPPEERGNFVATYMGSCVGIGVSFPLIQTLMNAWGWEWAVRLPSLLCLLWCVGWWLCAFDSPHQHPRISNRELKYLEDNVSFPTTYQQKLPLFPVTAVFRSKPFWALLLANLSSLLAFTIVTTFGPIYLHKIYNLDVKQNGFLAVLPFLSRFGGSLFFCWMLDKLISMKHCSLTTARRNANAASQLIPSILFMLVGSVGCNFQAEVIILTAASFVGGCASAGPLANTLDLAPNYAGTIMGLMSSFGTGGGFLVPMLVNSIIGEDQLMENWALVFQFTALFATVALIVFSIYGTGQVQPWNEPPGMTRTTAQVELVALKEQANTNTTKL